VECASIVSPKNGERMMELQKIFPYILIAFLIGVGVASGFTILHGVLILLFSLALSSLVIFALYKNRTALYSVFVIVGVTLGMLRFMMWEERPLDPLLEERTGSVVLIDGVVDDEPDVRENATLLTLRVATLTEGASSTPVYGRIMLSASRYPEYAYGDALHVEGTLRHPKIIASLDGRVFDYPKYLAVKDIHYQIPFPKVARTRQNEGSSILSTLYFVKHAFLEKLATTFSEPSNALLGGLLLGGKQSLGSAWQDIFRRAGIVHVVVLSGYNMTIVSEWLVALFSFLGFYGSLSVGGVGIIFFALMTGAGATVLRAALMALIALLARATGRTYTMGRALLVAAVCMVLQNPSILAFDPSFQLSFLASLGLIFVSPVIEAHTTLFARLPVWREIFVSTLATQILVLPLLLYQTGMLSLVALPVNMIVLPVVPLTMLFGFIAGVLLFVFPFLGAFVAIPAKILLWWILTVASLSVTIPYAAVSVSISLSALVFTYGAITLSLFYFHRKAPLSVPPPSHFPQTATDKK
jgi:competence protein ComEC